MLYYVKFDVSDGNDVNKKNSEKECNISHYYYCLDKGFMFMSYVIMMSVIKPTNLMKSVNPNSIAILNICVINCRCVINSVNKSEAINSLKNANLSEKNG